MEPTWKLETGAGADTIFLPSEKLSEETLTKTKFGAVEQKHVLFSLFIHGTQESKQAMQYYSVVKA